MNNPDTSTRPGETPRRPAASELPSDYEGVDLTATTLESLVTWDVSAHARREQERLSSAAYRPPNASRGDH